MASSVSYGRQRPKIFPQGLYEESSTQRLPLGTTWDVTDGRGFIYCKNASTGGPTGPGYLIQSAAPDSYQYNIEVASAAAVGDDHVHVTVGNENITANKYSEGYLTHDYGTYKGEIYKINYHAAVSYATSTALTVYLSDYVRRVIAAADDVTLIRHKCMDVINCPANTPTGVVIGVSPIAPTASYYFWAQYKGPCAVLVDNSTTLIVGVPVQAYGDVAGACQVMTDGDEIPLIGNCLYIGAQNEMAIIDLHLPG